MSKQLNWIKKDSTWLTTWFNPTNKYGITKYKINHHNNYGYPYSLDYKGESLGDFKTLSSAKLFAQQSFDNEHKDKI